ncbi:MAG: type I-C CRISPR-associated protein Cas8c/Csd1 [Prevotella sp.]|nr:type I-C CRISPR-associated protein Cas8c/Csd1 [Prevotella sp.]
MNSASTAPSTVLPTILNLSVHHSDKLDRKDMILFERKKQEIINKLKGFPNHLSMDDQGRFFIGYYHQRQDFFIKSEENNNEE